MAIELQFLINNCKVFLKIYLKKALLEFRSACAVDGKVECAVDDHTKTTEHVEDFREVPHGEIEPAVLRKKGIFTKRTV
jgi:hypothetical protein